MLAALACLAALPAAAHEFWIEPREHLVAPGEEVVAELRNGEMYRGPNLPFIERWFERFEVWRGDEARALGGATGDRPAVSFTPETPGPRRIVYVSTADYKDFKTFAEFERYVRKEGLAWTVEAHRARGLPDESFRERYVRCAKALVAVGASGGLPADAPSDLPLELIALQDPHARPAPATLPVLLLWRGEPLAGAQVSVFADPGGGAEVTVARLRTGEDGRLSVPLAPGARYLLNALHMIALEGERAVWKSYWASLTFAAGG